MNALNERIVSKDQLGLSPFIVEEIRSVVCLKISDMMVPHSPFGYHSLLLGFF